MNIAVLPNIISVTTGPLPASRKVHVEGDIFPDLRVPMRQIDVHPLSISV